MLRRFLIIVVIALMGCQSGRIPCPDFKADRVKRSHFRWQWHHDRNTTASAREVPAQSEKPAKVIDYQRGSEVKPALENINVEEWDCPKPGGKKNIPKALKDNIRKNKKAYESYYRNRADSLHSIQKSDLK